MLYAGLVWLQFTEEQFWRLTPRKLFVLLAVHKAMNTSETTKGNKSAVQTGNVCIDQVKGW